jgi:hypothetical protein
MCLFKVRGFHPLNRPLIAKEDIICYKKLQQIGDAYITPCSNTQVPIECIRNKVPFKAQILSKCKFIWRHILGFNNKVEDGFIHSFQIDHRLRDYLTFKCIIPKGTKYFVGIHGDYASERIIFLERLP